MAAHRNQPKDMDTFRRLLKSHGLKATPQRIAVHTVMLEMIHASADQVYEAIQRAALCRITKASVYNILSGLADEGIYSRRMGASSKMVFDINPYRHVHLYDTRNNEFMDIEADALLAAAEQGIKRRRFRGYKIDGIDIQILCHPTRKKYL